MLSGFGKGLEDTPIPCPEARWRIVLMMPICRVILPPPKMMPLTWFILLQGISLPLASKETRVAELLPGDCWTRARIR